MKLVVYLRICFSPLGGGPTVTAVGVHGCPPPDLQLPRPYNSRQEFYDESSLLQTSQTTDLLQLTSQDATNRSAGLYWDNHPSRSGLQDEQLGTAEMNGAVSNVSLEWTPSNFSSRFKEKPEQDAIRNLLNRQSGEL